MKPVMTVEGVGKKYLLGHKRENLPDTFRDRLTQTGEKIVRRVRHPFLPGSSDTVEEFWALRNIGFEVNPGDQLGIIGRNGAGKSTLLKILSRIVEPTTGRIEMRGRVSSLLEVGTGFHPELTGRENVYLNGAILGMSKSEIDRRFDEIVDFSEVEQFLDTPVKRYSSGMYVRLAFAVAAHLEPEIFIVDEVLAVGDSAFQKKCLAKMGMIGEQGKTVIYVSHNMATVRKLCNRALVLDKGELTFAGPVDEAADFYLGAQHRTSGKWPLVDDLYTDREKFHFTEIRINGEEPAARMNFNGREPLQIDFAFRVGAPLENLRIFVDLEDSQGELIGRSFHDSESSEVSAFEPGEYTLSVEIPPELWGPGPYQLVFRAHQSGLRNLTEREGLRVELRPNLLPHWNHPYPEQRFTAKISLPLRWKSPEVQP